MLSKERPSPANWIKDFVADQQHVKSTTWQEIAANIRPFGESTAGQVVDTSDPALGIFITPEHVNTKMAQILRQAELKASLKGGDQPDTVKSETAACLSQLEIHMYSMLLVLNMMSVSSYKHPSGAYFESAVLDALWQLSLQLGDLTPKDSNNRAGQPDDNAKSLVTLVAGVVVSSLFSGGSRHIDMGGPDSVFCIPFDVLCSFSALHAGFQQAAAAEIGSEGESSDTMAHLNKTASMMP